MSPSLPAVRRWLSPIAIALLSCLPAVSACLLAAGCSGNLGGLGQVTVGPAGGTLLSSDGRLRLEIPAGALDTEIVLTLRPLADGSLPRGSLLGTGYELGPEGLRFASLATLSVRVEGEADSRWLRLVELGPAGAAALRGAAVDPATRSVQALLHGAARLVVMDLALSDATVASEQVPVRDIDVLFVVDNSQSMREEQANLARNFPLLLAPLQAAGFSYHVGVVSTDIGTGPYRPKTCETQGGDGGRLQSQPRVPGCTPPSDPFIAVAGDASNVPGGDVAAAFSCIAQLGSSGCGFEQPLEAARLALSPPNTDPSGANAGFLRPGAALALVVISDEDDCSAANPQLFDTSQTKLSDPLGPLTSFRCAEFGYLCDGKPIERTVPGPRQSCQPIPEADSRDLYLHPVEELVRFFKELKPAGLVIASVVSGPPQPLVVGTDPEGYPELEPSCLGSDGQATPSIRLRAFAAAFGDRAVTANVCNDSFGNLFGDLGSLAVSRTTQTWCLGFVPTDTEPEQPGLQADCRAWPSSGDPLPTCSTTTASGCFRIELAAECGGSAQLSLHGVAPRPAGGSIHLECAALDQPR